MEQYTTATTTTGEQIVVQAANGQIQQQVSSGHPLINLIAANKSLQCHQKRNLLQQDDMHPEFQGFLGFQIQSILLILTCLRLYCPALPADTGHSDGCAAANRGASGDGLRPAGADTPGSGVTAGLCQCHESVSLQVCMF